MGGIGIREIFGLPRRRFTAVTRRGAGFEWTTVAGRSGKTERVAQGFACGADVEIPAGSPAPCNPPDAAVHAGIPSASLLLRVLDLPDVPDDEIKGMVELQADKISPFPLETMVISHEILERRGGRCRALLAAAREDTVAAFIEQLKGAGFEALRVDVDALGWARVIHEAGAAPAEGRHAALILSDGVPELIIFQDGCPVLFRTIVEADGLEGEGFAEEIANVVGYALLGVEVDRGPATASFRIWHSGALPAGLAERLARECRIEPEVAALDRLKPVSEGLALRAADGVERINLAPKSWMERKDAALFRSRMLAAAGIAAVVWALAVGTAAGVAGFQRLRLARLQEEFRQWQQRAREVEVIRDRVNVAKTYGNRKYSALECLRQIAVIQPAGVELSSFSYRGREEARISGDAPSVEDVYAFKNSLDETHFFNSVSLNGPVLDPRRGKHTFEMVLTLPGGGGAP